MSRTILFRGNSRYKVGHAYPTPPLVGPIKTRDRLDTYTGNPTGEQETILGWEVGDTVVFDRALAQRYNRLGSDPNDDGEEWAQLHLDACNNGDKPGDEAFVFVTVPAKKPHQSDDSPAGA